MNFEHSAPVNNMKLSSNNSFKAFMPKNGHSQSKSILVATAVLIAGLVASYFLMPSFQSFINEAYQILTSGDNQQISQWVKQFGFWGPLFIVFATVAQMFLLVINVVLLVLVAILAYGTLWGALLQFPAFV